MDKEYLFTLMDSCTRKISQAIVITTPPDFPSYVQRAMRFLLEKEMERAGVSIPIVFVEKEQA